MSSNLYLFLETSRADAALPAMLRDLQVPGYSFSSDPLQKTLDAPGEPSVPLHFGFYAQNYFRIFVADRAVQFYREGKLPLELVAGEQHLVSTILAMPQFSLRRWIVTDEGWEDDDEPYATVLNEGTDVGGLLTDLTTR